MVFVLSVVVIFLKEGKLVYKNSCCLGNPVVSLLWDFNLASDGENKKMAKEF